jgi:hypothetical protein
MTESFEQFTARQLSFTQWEFLAEHFAGPRPVIAAEERTRVALIRHRLISCDPYVLPRTTVLTERGHGVMCAAMGMMADILIATGYDGIRNPKPQPMKAERYGYGKCPQTESGSRDGELSALAQYRSD